MAESRLIKIANVKLSPNPVTTKGSYLVQVSIESAPVWLDYPYDYAYDYTKGEEDMDVSTLKATVNGQEITLTRNGQTNEWTANATAPEKSSYNQTGHYYPVTVKATDVAGNSTEIDSTHTTLGASLRLVVKEKVAPVITISSPSAGAYLVNNKPTITWTVTDNDSGVDPDTIGITIDSGSKITGTSITKSPITNGYSCSYTPGTALDDGAHTIKVDASDNDGNAATQKSVAFTVDTVPPTLSVTSPEEGYVTNATDITVTGVTNDETSSPVTLTIKLNNGAATPVTVRSNGSFSKQLTLTEGENTIVVTATDSAGKTSTVTRHVTLGTTPPQILSVTIEPNPVDAGATYVITVEVAD